MIDVESFAIGSDAIETYSELKTHEENARMPCCANSLK